MGPTNRTIKENEATLPLEIEQVPSKPNGAIVAVPERLALTPVMELVRIAVSQNADMERLQKLLDMQERLERDEARKAFTAAMSRFKAQPIVIERDKVNSQYKSRYVSLGNLVTTVTPYLSEQGLSASWDLDQGIPDVIRVTCKITHSAGHSESVSVTLPPDVSGSKNPLQEIKSAITYGKGCTFESICGLASTDGNVDDDGGSARVAPADVEKYCSEISKAKDLADLKQRFGFTYDKAREINDRKAMANYVQAKDKRKGELEHAGH